MRKLLLALLLTSCSALHIHEMTDAEFERYEARQVVLVQGLASTALEKGDLTPEALAVIVAGLRSVAAGSVASLALAFDGELDGYASVGLLLVLFELEDELGDPGAVLGERGTALLSALADALEGVSAR